MVATTSNYANAFSLRLAEGRLFSPGENDDARNVAVLGADIAKKLFPGQDPLGETVTINKHAFLIVGTLQDEPTANHWNSSILIPLNTCKQRIGDKVFIRKSGRFYGESVQLHEILVTVRDTSRVHSTANAIAELLGKAHSSKDWAIDLGMPNK